VTGGRKVEERGGCSWRGVWEMGRGGLGGGWGRRRGVRVWWVGLGSLRVVRQGASEGAGLSIGRGEGSILDVGVGGESLVERGEYV